MSKSVDILVNKALASKGPREAGVRVTLANFVNEYPLFGHKPDKSGFCVFRLNGELGGKWEVNAGAFGLDEIPLFAEYSRTKSYLQALAIGGTITIEEFDQAVKWLTEAGLVISMRRG